MFNWIESKCLDCKEPFLMSIDEKKVFAKSWCHKCIDPKVKHIRAKIIMGYYDIDNITAEIANKIVEKELNETNRRTIQTDIYTGS